MNQHAIGIICVLLFCGCHPSRQVGELVGVSEVKTLEDTYWVLSELEGKPVPAGGKEIFIQFNKEDKGLAGFSGCNRISGSYLLSGKEIKLTLLSTKMACSSTMETENAYLAAMDRVNDYNIRNDELELKNGGQILLRFLAGGKGKN